MKVYDVYDKDSSILSHGKNVFLTLEKYFSQFPDKYSECYHRNLENLELIKVDRLPDRSLGIYNLEMNTIVFSKNYVLGHELIHMSTHDTVNKQYAFESGLHVENGMIEGMTEYHHMKAFSLKKPNAYSFEVFTVMMLDDIPNIFESFFIPKEKGIFDACPNRKDMYGLLYSLDSYDEMMLEYVYEIANGKKPVVNKSDARVAIRHVIDNLISIKLSIENDPKKLCEYATKFMDLINSEFISDIVSCFYPNYVNYADKEIKRRIREKD